MDLGPEEDRWLFFSLGMLRMRLVALSRRKKAVCLFLRTSCVEASTVRCWQERLSRGNFSGYPNGSECLCLIWPIKMKEGNRTNIIFGKVGTHPVIGKQEPVFRVSMKGKRLRIFENDHHPAARGSLFSRPRLSGDMTRDPQNFRPETTLGCFATQPTMFRG